MEKENRTSVTNGFSSEKPTGESSINELNSTRLMDEISTDLSAGEIFSAEKKFYRAISNAKKI